MARAVGSVSATSFAAIDPAIDLAERAAREAMAQASVADGEPLPCFLGVSKGAVHALTRCAQLHVRGKLDAPAAGVLALGPVGLMAHHLQRRLGITVVSTPVAACASSLTALHLARLALLHPSAGRLYTRVLVLTSEAALLPQFIHSYQRLGVLPPLTPSEYAGCPLDVDRRGFLLSELAAAVVLERVDDPEQASKVKPRLWLEDTAVACEDFDLVRPSPSMPALAAVAARLLNARPSGSDAEAQRQPAGHIDMIHPHATGTQDQDPGELAIYDELWRDGPPPALYAAKGAVGHGLGAAGLVSLVLACLMARTSRRLPMPWLARPLPTKMTLSPESGTLPVNSRHAVFAAGFGGHVAGAVVAYRPPGNPAY